MSMTMIVIMPITSVLGGFRRSLRLFGVKAVLIEPGTHKTNLTSSQNYSNLFTAAWNGASAEAKAEYGEEYLKGCMYLLVIKIYPLSSSLIKLGRSIWN